jgi:hypothetical protein
VRLYELEKDIEEDVCKWAKDHYIRPIKLNLRFNNGWPDRMFLYGPFLVFIEFKKPGEEPEPIQLERIAELRANGQTVEVFDDAKRATDFLESTLLSEEWRFANAATSVRWTPVQAGSRKDRSLLHGVSHPSRKRVR